MLICLIMPIMHIMPIILYSAESPVAASHDAIAAVTTTAIETPIPKLTRHHGNHLLQHDSTISVADSDDATPEAPCERGPRHHCHRDNRCHQHSHPGDD